MQATKVGDDDLTDGVEGLNVFGKGRTGLPQFAYVNRKHRAI